MERGEDVFLKKFTVVYIQKGLTPGYTTQALNKKIKKIKYILVYYEFNWKIGKYILIWLCYHNIIS